MPATARRPSKPTRDEIAAAHGKTVRDLIAPSLNVLFCGINPSLYSAAIGHHFGRPGNRFWPTLFGAGFTDRLLAPWEGDELLKHGYGITNLVDRATAAADELEAEELAAGARKLARKVRRHRPRCVAVLGITAYRAAFKQPGAIAGRQSDQLAGAAIWVLPNPSGLNAHFQLAGLSKLFRDMREVFETPAGSPGR
jgi:TDG/mug DNA glycosylase family protein